MRCDEVQERIIELLYNERGTPSASPELRAHVRSCPACQAELSDLRSVQGSLKAWKDEPLLRPVSIAAPPQNVVAVRRLSPRVARFAAIAAMVVLAFLALANAEVKWNKEGFSFRTRLLSGAAPAAGLADTYTRAEVRDIIKAVADDSETRMNETTFRMIQRMLDAIEDERQLDLRHFSSKVAQLRSKN